MKKITLLLSILIISCTGNSQNSNGLHSEDENNSKNTISELLKYFEKKNSLIPMTLAETVLKIDHMNQAYSGCFSELMMSEGELTILVVRLPCTAGAQCEWKTLFVFKEDQLVSKMNIGKEISDNSFSSHIIYEFVNDSLIQLLSRTKEYKINYESEDDERELVFDSSSIEYYVINYKGKIIKVRNTLNNDREFPMTSYQVLKKDDLKKYSKNELDIMRNEIFATYGYEFKTKKWKDYFSAKEWYMPKSDDVNNLLSEIELVNVARIVEISSGK